MKNLFLIIFCLLIGRVSYGQEEIKISEKRYSELKSFEDTVKSLRQQVEKARTDLSSSKVSSEASKKMLEENVKNLKVELKAKSETLVALERENQDFKGLEGTNKKLAEELAGKKAELAKMKGKIENAEVLEGKNKELTRDNGQIAALKNQVKGLKATEDSLSKIQIERTSILAKIVELNKNVDAKKIEIEAKNKQIEQFLPTKQERDALLTEKANLASRVKDLNGSISNLNTKITQANQQKLEAETKIQPLQNQNQELKNSLFNSLKFSVDYLLNSTEYNSAKTQELLTQLEPLKANNPEINNWSAKLNQSKQLADNITEARKVLSVPYARETCNSAIQKLSASPSLTSKQKEDIDSHKKLLSDYCTMSNKAIKEIKDAQIFLPDEANKTQAMLKKFLNQSNVVGYTYLVTEVWKVINNPSLTNPIRATICN